MSRIRIKNFGPIKEGFNENDGWMEIKNVTFLIGNHGSGKSYNAPQFLDQRLKCVSLHKN